MSKTTSLYAVLNTTKQLYYAGFNTEKQVAEFSDCPATAKLFTNKYDIKLRPDELLVEIQVDLSAVPIVVSKPFRPARRKPVQH